MIRIGEKLVCPRCGADIAEAKETIEPAKGLRYAQFEFYVYTPKAGERITCWNCRTACTENGRIYTQFGWRP